MKILFTWFNKDTFGCKPLGIALLSALLKSRGHEVKLFDTTFMDLGCTDYNAELTKLGFFKPVDYKCDVEKKKVNVVEELNKACDEFKPDLIAVSVLSDEVEVAAKCLRGIRNRPPILIGNKGATQLFNEMKQEPSDSFSVVLNRTVSMYEGEALADFIIIVEEKFYSFIREFKASGYYKDLDKLPYVDWEIFDKRHFLKAYNGSVLRGGDHMIGWGCTNSCTYCINAHWREIHGGMHGCIRAYSIDRIIKELKHLKSTYELEFFKFHDEDFLLKSLPYLEELAEKYVENINLPFVAMTNAKSVTKQKAMLLAYMGCKSVSIGIEAGDSEMRKMLNRRETPEDIVSAVKILHQVGIRVSAFNMIGLPYETEETIKATIELNRRAGIRHPNVSFFMPLKGTVLYDISVAAGFYDPKEKRELRTDRPTLKLNGISEERLLYYYKNFHNLIAKGFV